MLLITRREGEALVINGSIEVRILEIRGGRVKLGVEYPAGNTVFRQELFAKIQAENQAAVQPLAASDSDRLNAALGKLLKPQVGTDTASGTGNKKGPTDDDHSSQRDTPSDDE
ncbi:MAG: carbon storage regulator [Pseudomonadota bacterium]|jgi:carbon storage regulator